MLKPGTSPPLFPAALVYSVLPFSWSRLRAIRIGPKMGLRRNHRPSRTRFSNYLKARAFSGAAWEELFALWWSKAVVCNLPMKEQPHAKVSIIIRPSSGQISQCSVESALQQTFSDREVIVHR